MTEKNQRPTLPGVVHTHWTVEHAVPQQELGDPFSVTHRFYSRKEADAYFDHILKAPDGPLPGGHGKHTLMMHTITSMVTRHSGVDYAPPKPAPLKVKSKAVPSSKHPVCKIESVVSEPAKQAPPKRKSVVKVKLKKDAS